MSHTSSVTIPEAMPSGATHYLSPFFYREDVDGKVFYMERGNWVSSCYKPGQLDKCGALRIGKEPAWTGEGLPPVGTVCEFAVSGDLWRDCKVVYHSNKREAALVLYGADFECAGWAMKFRPIRTPEQIAAEERVKAAQEWLKGIEREYGVDVADQCEAILLEAEERRKHDNHKPDFPKSEEQASSEVHQANRELAEQRLRRLAEIEDKLLTLKMRDHQLLRELRDEKAEILSHYREPQA